MNRCYFDLNRGYIKSIFIYFNKNPSKLLVKMSKWLKTYCQQALLSETVRIPEGLLPICSRTDLKTLASNRLSELVFQNRWKILRDS